MKRLVEFPSENGQVILVEVDDLGSSGPTRRGLSPSAMVERAQTSFETALGKVRPIGSTLIDKLQGMSEPPDEVKVEFGLSLSAEVGAVLAAASTQAHYKVTLTWQRPREQ